MPNGAILIKHKKASEVAHKLSIDYAKAVIGFTYNRGRPIPTYDGIVIAIEYRDLIEHALREVDDRVRLEKERKVVEKWRRFVVGVLARDKLMKEYLPG